MELGNNHDNLLSVPQGSQERRPSGVSKKSGTSYGSMARSVSGIYIKRHSIVSATSKTFERPFLRNVPSGRSLGSQGTSHASIRTRLTSISRSEYHCDLKVSLKATVTRNLVFATFIVCFGSSFQFGYNIGVLNNPNQLIKDFYNETYTERYGYISEHTLTLLWSLTTAIFLPGGMAGAFLGGALADKLGRKRAILLSQTFTFVGAILGCICTYTKAPELLMVARVLFGLNSGLGNCLAPMFLSEVAPVNLRGAFGTVHQLSITLGIFLSSVLGLRPLMGTESRWPFLLLLQAVPAMVSCFVLPFLPETPRYLLLIKSKRREAEKSLQFYRQREDVAVDMEEMDTEQAAVEITSPLELQAPAEVYTLKKLLTDMSLRTPIFIACALQVIQQFSGVNAIFFYSSGIFENAGVPSEQIPYAVIGTNAVNVAMTIISVPLMDIAGRRLLLLVPMLAMIFDLILITISLNLQSKLFWMNYVSVVAVIVYVICFAVGLGPIPMMIGAELFRQGPRPLAIACAGVTNWICTFIIAIGFESVQLALKNYTFVVFLVLMCFFILFTFFKVPETRNKTFEEIAHQFSPGGHLEVEEMLDDVFDEMDDDDDHDDIDGSNLVTVDFGMGGENKPIKRKSEKSTDGDEPIPLSGIQKKSMENGHEPINVMQEDSPNTPTDADGLLPQESDRNESS